MVFLECKGAKVLMSEYDVRIRCKLKSGIKKNHGLTCMLQYNSKVINYRVDFHYKPFLQYGFRVTFAQICADSDDSIS